MRLPRIRFSLWHIMMVIAAFAVIATYLGVLAASGLLILAGVIAIPILLITPGSRFEAVAWFLCACPVFYLCSLYGTLLIAWLPTGLRSPGAFANPVAVHGPLIVPLCITFILMAISPFAMVFCGPLMLGVVCQRIRRKDIGILGAALRLSVPLCLWAVLYAIGRWDFLNLIDLH
jgi:hypothetical protein